MEEFDYAAPADLDQAIQMLSKAGDRAKILAGGTDIIVQLREGLREADLVVDVKHIPELMEMEYDDAGLRLGASVPCWRIYDDKRIAAKYAALADATRIVGGWQIQSRASVGGNLCNSSPAADTIPPLFVYEATCHIAGPEGRRVVPVRDFCTGPGRNVLGAGELLAAITLPPQDANCGSAYLRFIPRNEMDIAVAGVASWVRLDDSGENIAEARIALAAVAPTPVAADEAGAWLAGRPCTESTYEQAGDWARSVATPIDDMRGDAEYRRHLVGVLTKRTLAIAVERAAAAS